MKLYGMIGLMLTLASGAFAQDVRYNFDRSADFSKYRTYKWVQVKGAAQLAQLPDQQLKSAIDAELSRKGLVKSDGESDLLVAYQAAINQEKEFSSYTSGFGPGWGYGAGWGYGGFGGSTTTTGQTWTIHIGSVGLDMYEAAKQKLIWRGEASKTLDMKAKPDKVQKNLQKAMAKMLKNYPPPIKN
jgi:Domain of unknown function (DUF4136)